VVRIESKRNILDKKGPARYPNGRISISCVFRNIRYAGQMKRARNMIKHSERTIVLGSYFEVLFSMASFLISLFSELPLNVTSESDGGHFSDCDYRPKFSLHFPFYQEVTYG